MIEYIHGRIDSLTPTEAVLECSGVGYLLNISLSTYEKLKDTSSARLLVHEAIREDSNTLYGFIDEKERSLFRALIGVSGVGAGLARIILSAITASELEMVIATGDHKRLTTAKGLGAKKAQRIIVDLRDKIKPAGETLLEQPATQSDVFDEALAALVMLGFARAQAHKTLKKVFEAEPLIKVETAIKKALAMM